MTVQTQPFWDQLHSLYLAGELGQLLELADAVEQTVWRDLIRAHAALERALVRQKTVIKLAAHSGHIDWHGLAVSSNAASILLRGRLVDAGISGIHTPLAVRAAHQRLMTSLDEAGYRALLKTSAV